MTTRFAANRMALPPPFVRPHGSRLRFTDAEPAILAAGHRKASSARPTREQDATLRAVLFRLAVLAATLTLVALLAATLSAPTPIIAAAAAIALAGFAAAAISETIRRRPPARPLRGAPGISTPPMREPMDEDTSMNPRTTSVHELAAVPFWGRTSIRIIAAISVMSLVAGFLLPDRYAAPVIGLGLAGLLAIRLFAASAVRRSGLTNSF